METITFALQAFSLTSVLFGLCVMVIDAADWEPIPDNQTGDAGWDYGTAIEIARAVSTGRLDERGLSPLGGYDELD